MQVCWLFLLPCMLAAAWDASARRTYALALPAGAMLATERAWWASLCVPSNAQLAFLFMPAISTAVWRIMVLAAAS